MNRREKKRLAREHRVVRRTAVRMFQRRRDYREMRRMRKAGYWEIQSTLLNTALEAVGFYAELRRQVSEMRAATFAFADPAVADFKLSGRLSA